MQLLTADATLTPTGWKLLGLALVTMFIIGVVISPPPDACAKDPNCPIHDLQR